MDFLLSLKRTSSNTIVIDLLSLAAIAFLPALSHMFNFPFYLLEPMRILLIVSITHTSKRNSFIVAAALPVFSFLLSLHPAIFKSLLVLAELSLNVWLFYLLDKKFNSPIMGMIVSIITSKLFYYCAKYLMIRASLIEGEFITTPIYLQAIVGLVLSVYIHFAWKKNSAKAEH